MIRRCEECRTTYDDFNHLTICPHEAFAPSEDARKALIAHGVDPDTGRGLAEPVALVAWTASDLTMRTEWRITRFADGSVHVECENADPRRGGTLRMSGEDWAGVVRMMGTGPG